MHHALIRAAAKTATAVGVLVGGVGCPGPVAPATVPQTATIEVPATDTPYRGPLIDGTAIARLSSLGLRSGQG